MALTEPICEYSTRPMSANHVLCTLIFWFFIMADYQNDDRLNEHFTLWMCDLLCRLVPNTP